MSSKPAGHMAQETTPLLNGEPSDPHHSNGSNHHGHIHVSRGTGAVQFLFSSKFTPGTDNQNVVVRSLAYGWHITKVTLLSSMSSIIPQTLADPSRPSPRCKING